MLGSKRKRGDVGYRARFKDWKKSIFAEQCMDARSLTPALIQMLEEVIKVEEVSV
jgi:hypothetical protein